MLKKLRRARDWMMIVPDYHKNKFSVFLQNLSEYDDKYGLNHYERSLKASALFMQSEFEDSKTELFLLAEDLQHPKTDKERYILLYTRAILGEIDGNRDQRNQAMKEAASLRVGPLYRRMLPL